MKPNYTLEGLRTLMWRVLLAAACCAGAAAPPARAADELDFSSEQKKQFVDALRRFPSKVQPFIGYKQTHNQSYWIDHRRLIRTARTLPSGWRAAPGEPSKIVVLDTDTGQIEELPYRGDLECYSGARMIVRTYAPGADGPNMGAPTHGEVILAGKLGEELKPIEWLPGQQIAQIDCQFVAWDTHNKTLSYRLSDGQGTLAVSAREANPVSGAGWTLSLRDDAGKQIASLPATSRSSPPGMAFTYLPWSRQYFVQAAFPSGFSLPAGSVLSLSGDLRLLWAPPVLANGNGSGAPLLLRDGVLWQFRPWWKRWRQQGLYLERGGLLLRVEDGDIGDAAVVSPDGCKLYYSRTDGDPYAARWERGPAVPDRFKQLVMNFCEESQP